MVNVEEIDKNFKKFLENHVLKNYGMIIDINERRFGFSGVSYKYAFSGKGHQVEFSFEAGFTEGVTQNLEKLLSEEMGSKNKLEEEGYFGRYNLKTDSIYASVKCRLKWIPDKEKDLQLLYNEIWGKIMLKVMRGVEKAKIKQ